MVNYAFVLVPLYIYPSPPTLWNPLFEAARSYPNTTFRAIINPDSGPGSGSCPDSDFITALTELNSIPNIQTLAYVHTADSYSIADCDGICVCTQLASAVEANISTYRNWPSSHCTAGTSSSSKDIHIDGIFFDESPQTATSDHLSFMQQVSTFARQTLTRGSTTLFNVGALPDSEFWGLADYINVFEGTEIDLRNVNLTAGVVGFASQATVIVQSYRSNETQLSKNVRDILGVNNGAGFAGLFVSDWGLYDAFSSLWNGFAGDFDLARMSNS
jgi:hypothetical protein